MLAQAASASAYQTMPDDPRAVKVKAVATAAPTIRPPSRKR
jgi:hypothetical protein